ncbi:laminin subunit gamma-1 [Condylostylus longicornis]|uniref:laminin subunit gamma-1 n=1 Tax=Condylostylus longicornis TaxID=2530218 RepID=UPI00244E54EA|nr:laminin subunit gamma-1 [Condylostylus longicornis]
MKKLKWINSQQILLSILVILGCQNKYGINANENTHFLPALACYDTYGRPQKCIPEFVNAAYNIRMESTNTCGEHGEREFCVQTGYSNKKSCDICRYRDHDSIYLTDIHDPQNPTWWQSETMFEGVQHPNQVNLTLRFGKTYDITYIRIVFRSPRPESFAIYKRVSHNGPWIPYQFYSATCRDTYGLPDGSSIQRGEDESRALCTSEYSDISPLRDGNIAFSTLEGRPSAINFENSLTLQNWVTATDIKITLDRLNTFGDEVFFDAQVLKSYFYAISDIAVGARCKCNGHASNCVVSTGLNGEHTKVCECKHNTDGPDCERCLPAFNDQEWKRATSKNVNECKPCNCNGKSEKCFFDRALFNLTGHGGHCIDCRDNRDGPHCERCKENFYMREDGYCIHCGCDPIGSRSLQCNTEGKCQCKPGVTGEKCDRCDSNYYQFSIHGCQPCGCDPRGSLDNKPYCDPNTGHCLCKENVEGEQCKECKPGYFNLNSDNRFGCTPCFCYGHTSQCHSAHGYSAISIISSFNKGNERWTATDNYNRRVDLKYNQYSHSIVTIANGNDYVYFNASDRFLGNQRASYNHLLKFQLHLVGQISPNPSSYDVILEGSGSKIALPIFAQGNPLPDQNKREYKFRLHEHPDYQWQPSQSARSFMSILSNLTAIRIRASYSVQGEAILDDVELETAHLGVAGKPATWIEYCTCPEGYLGNFCESCAPGYRHSPARGGPFSPCIPCDCHKHAEICDSETGRCICQHNTAGESCDQCARGYYGNALVGTQWDCKKCPCPNDGACLQMPDDTVICLECPMGYFGARCELCSDGYYGDPNGLIGEVRDCKSCDCNGNVDPNAVGNCNRTTGQCLKCIYNTDGDHCDQCLPGHFGDPLDLPHGHCEQCNCVPAGTEQTEDGISICDQLTGNCRCKPNVFGRDCNECEPGYFNLVSGNGCESCNCNPIGSYNSSCDLFSGQCFCKPGVTGEHCDQCATYYYGFSNEGCLACDCDQSGSKGYQCDQYGQCPCNDNVEGRRCDRCKENKYDRHQGCLDCPACYNLVKDAADDHRAKLRSLSETLDNIAKSPVTNDDEFELKLKDVQQKVNILLDDAKAGAGGGDKSLIEKLNDLHELLDNIQIMLDNSKPLQVSANLEIEKVAKNITLADNIYQNAKNELAIALELLNNEGETALQKARDKANKFGEQSEQISEISREARAIADELESQAELDLKNATDAHAAAQKAYDLAKNAINLQKNISDELRTDMRLELDSLKASLGSTSQLTKEALRKASESFDAALELFTNVNRMEIPEINTQHLKDLAADAHQQAILLQNKVEGASNENDLILIEADEENALARTLIERGRIQKQDDIDLYNEAKSAYDHAVKAVAQGDSTLKEANATYYTLADFQADVQKSSENAQLALKTVPGIENEIKIAEGMIRDAEMALSGALGNANEARKNAQEAQEKFAEQASKDAENIRKKATETKQKAKQLREEADQLNHRVLITEQEARQSEESTKKDSNLLADASRKVGEANTGTLEARDQALKAVTEINSIMEILNNLKDINVDELDSLEKRLNVAERELNKANLTERINKLTENRNSQNKWIAKYEREVNQLRAEVNNIEAISAALPDDCFKNNKLEP